MKEEKQNYIYVGKEKVYVTDEVYKAYWNETNHENYVITADRRNQVVNFSAFKLLDSDRSIEESIVDKNMDLEKLIEFKESVAALYAAMDKLTLEEKEVIKGLFFDKQTQSEVAKKLDINQRTVGRKKDKSLEKLKKLLINFK